MGIETIQGKRYFSVTDSAPVPVARQAAVTGKRIFVTDIAGSSDKSNAVLEVKEGTVTVKFAIQLESGAATPYSFSHRFESPIIGAVSTPMEVTVTGNAVAKANISGFIA